MARITRDDMTAIEVVIPKAAKEALENYAKNLSTEQVRVYVSDVVRGALTEHFKRLGIEVDFSVDRGGDRRTKPAAVDDQDE